MLLNFWNRWKLYYLVALGFKPVCDAYFLRMMQVLQTFWAGNMVPVSYRITAANRSLGLWVSSSLPLSRPWGMRPISKSCGYTPLKISAKIRPLSCFFLCFWNFGFFIFWSPAHAVPYELNLLSGTAQVCGNFLSIWIFHSNGENILRNGGGSPCLCLCRVFASSHWWQHHCPLDGYGSWYAVIALLSKNSCSSFHKPLQRFRDNLELRMGFGVYSGHLSRRELSAFSFTRVCAFIEYLWRTRFRCTPWQALTFVMLWNARAFEDRWFILLKISSRQENLLMKAAVLLALLLKYWVLLHWWASISYLLFGDRIAVDTS